MIFLLFNYNLLATLTTTTTTTNEMMPTSAATDASTVNVQKRRPICKWSGSDEPQSYYNHEDTDTATLTKHERNYIKWYQSKDHSKWRNADHDDVRGC